MKEVKCKFVAVDDKTVTSIRKAIEICGFDCELINVGDTEVQGAIEFGFLTTDDGLGKYIFTAILILHKLMTMFYNKFRSP